MDSEAFVISTMEVVHLSVFSRISWNLTKVSNRLLLLLPRGPRLQRKYRSQCRHCLIDVTFTLFRYRDRQFVFELESCFSETTHGFSEYRIYRFFSFLRNIYERCRFRRLEKWRCILSHLTFDQTAPMNRTYDAMCIDESNIVFDVTSSDRFKSIQPSSYCHKTSVVYV